MKRLIYILSLISIIVVSSCVQENVPGSGEVENCITLKICNSSLKTKVDREGNDIENTINTLDFYFFPQGATESNSTFYKRVTFENGVKESVDVHLYITEAEFKQIFPYNGQHNCVVFVIANLPADALPQEGAPTTLQALKSIHLENDFIDANGNPVVPASFVMHGENTLTRSSDKDNSVTGEVTLYRAASKITLRLKLPDHILVPKYDSDGNLFVDQSGNAVNEVWTPEFSASGATGGIAGTFVSLRNGVSADCLAAEYNPQPADYFNTQNVGSFTWQSSVQSSSSCAIHTYTCDATFYSYSSKWDSGDMYAPCFILQIPWKNNSASNPQYVTHYYQVQVNSYGKELAPNYWYDLTLNVGVLGSTVATLPLEIKSLSYEVLDWSTIMTVFDREEEEFELDEWQYLIIDESKVEMNNTNTGTFYFDASHPLAWNLEWPNEDEMTDEKYNFLINDFDALERQYNSTTKYASYYLDCSTTDPYAKCLNSGDLNLINNGCFSETGRKFTFTIPDRITDQSDLKIYSPVYVHVKVWLDMDDDDELDDNEKDYVYHLTFVYSPPLFIEPDTSTIYSVFVNGRHRHGTDIEHGSHNLGKASGTTNNNADGMSMYIISVSNFNKDNTFKWRAKAGDQYVDTSYIIGDPRSRTPMNFASYNMTNNWVKDQIPFNNNWTTYNQNVRNGKGRSLQYYYPTSTDEEAFRIIAPKFRISSYYGGYSNNCTPEGAMLRCASYQEDGYPAGRWRVPTTAEVQYVIMLQKEEVIVELFYNNNWYYSASQQIQDSGEVRANSDDKDHNDAIRSSVRCVYDEWYWGSEKEAVPNSGYAGGYEFTWGDKFIY